MRADDVMLLSGRGGARATLDRKESIPPPRSAPTAGYPPPFRRSVASINRSSFASIPSACFCMSFALALACHFTKHQTSTNMNTHGISGNTILIHNGESST